MRCIASITTAALAALIALAPVGASALEISQRPLASLEFDAGKGTTFEQLCVDGDMTFMLYKPGLSYLNVAFKYINSKESRVDLANYLSYPRWVSYSTTAISGARMKHGESSEYTHVMLESFNCRIVLSEQKSEFNTRTALTKNISVRVELLTYALPSMKKNEELYAVLMNNEKYPVTVSGTVWSVTGEWDSDIPNEKRTLENVHAVVLTISPTIINGIELSQLFYLN